MKFRSIVLTVTAASLAAAPGLAQEVAARPEAPAYGQGWHTVRPGETLIGLTRAYLGTSELWRENHRLNPEIEDPDVLVPGQRIRVLLEPAPVIPTARVNQLSGRVEARPAPIPWNAAREEDLLLERDGLRTFRKSSTEMEFQDGTRVLLTEESVVFFRQPPKRRGVERKSLEIVEGQADLEASLSPASEVDVEILIEGVRATPKGDAAGNTQARARRADAGTAQVMMYQGSGEIEASGQKVEVARGMGTSVPKGEPPAPPEKLLPAPQPTAPAAGAELGFGNPVFAWEPVEGAAGYTIELCRDAACALLVDRTTGLTGAEWRPAGLATGSYFWRATAVSRSGLDGYPGPASALTILSGGPDRQPPTGRLRLVGESLEVDGRELWAPSVRVEAEVTDAGVGVERWTPLRDGAKVGASGWEGPWSGGRHAVEAVATDRLGNEGRIGPLEFTVDAEPPTIRFEIRGPELVRQAAGAAADTRPVERLLRRTVRKIRGAASREGAPPWHTVAWAAGTSTPEDFVARLGSAERQLTLDRPLEVAGPEPEVVLLLPGRYSHVEIDRADSTPPGSLLRITAGDDGVGVSSLVVRPGPRAPSQDALPTILTVESTDRFGNRHTLDWRLVPARPLRGGSG